MATSIITSLNANLRPTLQNFADWAFMMDGENIPRYFDQNGGFELMHQDPTTAITAVVTAAGSLTGIYKYFYTEYNKPSGDGDMYSGHETNPSPIYTTADLSSKKAVLTLPGTATNTGFTHLKVYSTDAGGSIFYYIGSVAIGTTTLEDDNLARDANNAFGKVTTNADGTSSQTYYNYACSNHRYISATKTRLITCGVRDYNTGTVSVNNGATAVTGVGTAFTRAFVGSTIYFSGQSRGYVISAVASGTALTLAENYEGGTNLSGATFVITSDKSIVKWSALNPNNGKPMWWAFPATFYRRIRRHDDSDIMGLASLGDQAVVFKRKSHYLLTENGDDFYDTESNTRVGTCGHHTIVSVPDSGYLIFCSYEGKIYKTNGAEARDLAIYLEDLPSGVNMTRGENFTACWWDSKKWYILCYSSSGSSVNDKMLVYDDLLKEYVILDIYSNCISVIETTEDSEAVWKPYIGTTGGFIYKTMTGNNLGGTTGTLAGTSTAFGDATITDSTATFNTTDDGLKDVYVRLYDTSGDFKEQQKILSNTGTVITVDTNWTSTPVVGWTYEVGGIHWFWESKVFDLDNSATVRDCLLKFKKASSARDVKVKFYFSEDADMDGDSVSQTVTFDLNNNYYRPLSLRDNRSRFFKYRIEGHGTADPVVISSLNIAITGNAV